MTPPDDIYFMQHALKEAQLAFDAEEVPVGALVVINNKIIARGHNQVERLNDPTAHAEIIALTSAFNYIGAKYLPDATLYVTVEPCLMCCGAMYWSKIGRIVYGASDEKNGYKRFTDPAATYASAPFHPKTEIIKGIMAAECTWLMQSFFRARRK